jgi:uncharacterized membrane protein YbhN (UPF0104 family)
MIMQALCWYMSCVLTIVTTGYVLDPHSNSVRATVWHNTRICIFRRTTPVNSRVAAKALDRSMDIVRSYGVLIAVVMLASFGTIFIVSGRGEITEAFALISSINPAWLGLLALMQVAVLLVAGWSYQVLLKRQGHSVGLLRLIEVHLQRVVIGVVTPVGGPASIYVLMRALRANRIPDSDSLLVVSIRAVTGVIAFVVFLIPVLLLQTPSTIVMIATAGLFLVLAVTVWLSIIVLRQGDVPAFVRENAPERALAFIDAAKQHRITPVDFLVPSALALASHVLSAVMLFAGLHAVGFGAAIETALIGYVVGKLFFMMAPVFQGIGFVEIGMAIALQQAGVPAAVAVSGALLYRVGDLWMPLSWGFIVQLVRMPVREYLSTSADQARDMANGFGETVDCLRRQAYRRTAYLGQVALVTEAPLALMFGAVLILAGGLPVVG